MLTPMRHDPSRLRTDLAAARRLLRWTPAAMWATVIFKLSSIPGSELPPSDYTAAAHFAVYAILGTLVYMAVRPNRTTAVAVCLAIVLSSAYGVSDEVHQAFVPGRTPDIADWGIDTIGAAAGASLAVLLGRWRLRLTRG